MSFGATNTVHIITPEDKKLIANATAAVIRLSGAMERLTVAMERRYGVNPKSAPIEEIDNDPTK